MKKLGLSGISVTQFDHRGAKAPERNLIMPGSHDNQSFLEFVEDLFNFGNDKDKKARFLKKTKYLAEDTAPKGAAKEEVKQYLKDIRTNKSKFIAASFAELFTSPAKRVQIFFADFWGLGKTYNRPGTTTGNWALRLEETFEDDYAHFRKFLRSFIINIWMINIYIVFSFRLCCVNKTFYCNSCT